MDAEPAPRRRDRGAALLLVVMIVGLLAVLVTEFQRRARLELQAARNLIDSVQIHALAISGREVAHVLLLEDLSDPRQAQYDGRDEFWNQVDLPVPIGDLGGRLGATVERIEDLDGKFPLGALVDSRGAADPKVASAFERFLGALNQQLMALDPPVDLLDQVNHQDLVDAVVDWMDEDDQGAFESNEGFTVPNVRISHLQDLQRVEGFGEVPEGYDYSVADVLLPYLDTRSDTTVNMNTAQVPVLVATHPGIRYSDAEDLFAALEDAPDTVKFDPRNHSSVSGIQQSLFELGTKITSDRFRVRLRVDVGEVRHFSEAILVRDRTRKGVGTEQWQEGWLPESWRPAFVDPAATLGFPGLMGGGTP